MAKKKEEVTPMQAAGIRPLSSREEMVNGVGEFRAWTIRKMKLEATRAKAVQDAEAEFAKDIDEAVVQIDGWNEAVKQFAVAHRPEVFGEQEFCDTVHGRVKLYLGSWGTKLMPKFDWDKVLKIVESFGLDNLFTRTSVVPDKEALLAYRDEPIPNPKNPKSPLMLEQLGVTCERGEFFEIEPKIEAVA